MDAFFIASRFYFAVIELSQNCPAHVVKAGHTGP